MEAQMAEAVPVFEAKNKLPFYIHKAESEGPVFLSRRNKEVVVMLSVTEYNRLLAQAKENRKQMSILDRVKDFHERNKDLYSDAEIDEIFVYCSNPDVQQFLPSGVTYLKRSESLDQDTSSINDVLSSFAKDVDSEIYVMTHATSPFVSAESIRKGLLAVMNDGYDSAFAVKKIQDFLWMNDKPLNYSLDKIARTQDLPPIYAETSGFYIYKNAIISEMNRRIGNNPLKVEVSDIEAVDIDEKFDFELANILYNNVINH